jgi:hypothetical protein
MSKTGLTPSPQLEETAVVQRLQETSFNREIARLDHRDAVSDHHEIRAEVLDESARRIIAEPTENILTDLRRSGLLWSTVAQAIGVSDAAIRKWRKGGPIEEAHKRRLARLASLARLHREYAVPSATTGFAEWLDTPVIPSFSATPLDLLALTRDRDSITLQPLLDWMLEHSDREHGAALLDRYLDNSWRHQAAEEQRFRIIRDAQGERVLVIDD